MQVVRSSMLVVLLPADPAVPTPGGSDPERARASQSTLTTGPRSPPRLSGASAIPKPSAACRSSARASSLPYTAGTLCAEAQLATPLFDQPETRARGRS